MLTVDHSYFMHQCIVLARIAKQNGESPVGAVVVKQKAIIRSGMEESKARKDISFHAEIVAIRQAVQLLNRQDLSGCTLYTTHEPCMMCSYMIRHSKIQTVVIGLPSGELGGYSSTFPILIADHFTKWSKPPNVVIGVLEKECSELHL